MTDRKRILCENIKHLKKSVQWLLKSSEKSRNIQISPDISEDEIETLETLSNRFSRTVDFLINKVLRSIDIYELEDTGTKLDTVIRAEKRGFVSDYKTLIQLKDLGNELAYQYLEEEIFHKFEEVVRLTPVLAGICSKVIKYIQEKNYCEGE